MVISWQDLGLPADIPIHVFDFWNAGYLGAWEVGMAVDVALTRCGVLALLPASGKV